MQKFYKVLGPSGESISGGKMDWSLPTSENPGDWMESHSLPDMCSAGLHLTTDPKVWIKSGSRIFEVEGRDFLTDDSGSILMREDKAVCRFARLIRELTDEEYVVHHLLKSGEHSVSEGRWIACGSATVKAHDSATVWAFNSATVEAHGSATVEVFDSATVEASGSAIVWAYDSATVRAYNSTTVTLLKFSKATVTLKDQSVLIDRREKDIPVVSTANGILK